MHMKKLQNLNHDYLFAQIALFVAIGLQIVVWKNNNSLTLGLHPFIILTELALAAILGVMSHTRTAVGNNAYRSASFLLLGLISIENITSMIMIVRLLISDGTGLSGYQLLGSAIAIFLTNIIVFALWYWEIDSPGLTGKRWSKHDRDFQFLQQEDAITYKDWRPNFIDYLYVSLTNAINFAASDTRPVTRQAKILMGVQALVSVTTLALVIARSVSILGE